MCRRWNGAEWQTLESGKDFKPHAIGFGNGTWIKASRPKVEYTSSFGDTDKNMKQITHLEQAEGWTWQEWVQRERYETRFTSNDHLPWPISTIAQTTGDRFHISKGVQLADGLIGVDSPDANHPNYTDFKKFKDNAVILGKYDNCMAEGLTLGRSTSFITAVMCEMLRAYTVRSIDPAVCLQSQQMDAHCVPFLIHHDSSAHYHPRCEADFLLGHPRLVLLLHCIYLRFRLRNKRRAFQVPLSPYTVGTSQRRLPT